jgi:hypothetical protein
LNNKRCKSRSAAAILAIPDDVVSSADGEVRVEPAESEKLIKPSGQWDRKDQVN